MRPSLSRVLAQAITWTSVHLERWASCMKRQETGQCRRYQKTSFLPQEQWNILSSASSISSLPCLYLEPQGNCNNDVTRGRLCTIFVSPHSDCLSEVHHAAAIGVLRSEIIPACSVRGEGLAQETRSAREFENQQRPRDEMQCLSVAGLAV